MKENEKADNEWHVVWEAELEWSKCVSEPVAFGPKLD